MDPKSTIDAVLAGDAARFADLVAQFDGLVRAVVRKRLTPGHAFEEVVQEAWLRVYRRLADLDDPRRVESWLSAIARNCARDHFRERARMQRFEPLSEIAAEDRPTPWVWELVAEMEPAFREVLVARYRDHRSYEEIAASLQVSISTVRGRLFMARNALRARIERRETER